MKETTLILCKPDAVERQLVGSILNRYEAKGLQIIAMKLMKVSTEQACKHYAEHKDKSFFSDLINFITGSAIVAIALRGNNAIEIARNINGATNPIKALPGTIRGDLATNPTFNLVHASDSKDSASRELGIFFDENEFIEYKNTSQKWL